MLNEIQEAYEYMYDLEKAEYSPNRIKLPVFLHNNDLNGLERMMTMIARRFIFDGDIDSVRGRRRAETALRMWLGLTEGLEDDCRLSDQYNYLRTKHPEIDHWLDRYMEEAVKTGYPGYKEKVETARSTIASKKQQFESKSLNASAKASDYKLIRYDKILANAQVARGPLKRYYLVCAEPNWKAGTFKTTGKTADAKIKAKDEDRILKLVAAYLLERGRKTKSNSHHVAEPVSFSDVTLWAAGGTRLSRNSFNIFTYEDSQTHKRRPLFSFYTAKSGSLTKALPDEDWLEYCGWDIIEATDGDDALDAFLDTYPGAVFFSDPGASRNLIRNGRYLR